MRYISYKCACVRSLYDSLQKFKMSGEKSGCSEREEKKKKKKMKLSA